MGPNVNNARPLYINCRDVIENSGCQRINTAVISLTLVPTYCLHDTAVLNSSAELRRFGSVFKRYEGLTYLSPNVSDLYFLEFFSRRTILSLSLVYAAGIMVLALASWSALGLPAM